MDSHSHRDDKPLIYDLTAQSLRQILKGWDEPAYRADQLWQGLYRRLWASPTEFSTLPGGLRRRLGLAFHFSSLTPVAELTSNDGETIKVAFRLPDGNAIETVLMRYRQRRTLCISTQAGCALGCVFCATGQMGLQRNLSAGEIVEQVLYFARRLAAEDDRLTNIVVMGMGEPFQNYEATLSAIDILNHPLGFGFGERRFTLSTVGIAPAIRRFAAEKRQINLAISLHAANDELRSRLLPVNRKYPLGVLMKACREYVAMTHRRITFEWALIQDVNDGSEHAHQLADLLSGLLCHVNVIPLNPTASYGGKAATRACAEAFRTVLEAAGIPCSIRLRRGIDIRAGCGQLAVTPT